MTLDPHATTSRAEHLRQAGLAADAVTAYAVDGSPEALLAGAVHHLVAAATGERPENAAGEPAVISDWFAHAILSAVVKKNPGLKVTLDEFLDANNVPLAAYYDARRRLWRIEEPQSVNPAR